MRIEHRVSFGHQGVILEEGSGSDDELERIWCKYTLVQGGMTVGDEIARLLAQCDKRPPASRAQIDDLMKNLGSQLPADYVEFLLFANGAVGFIGDNDMNYLNLWPAENVKLHGVYEFAPDLVFIGSNGASEGYAYDRSSPDLPIVNIPFIDAGSETPRVFGRSLQEFLQRLHDAPLFPE